MTHRRLVAVATAVVAGLAAATTAVPAHGASTAGLDGPGRYFLVRTYPQTTGPSAEQNAACDAHFGPLRSATAGLRQAAVQFAPLADRSGLAVDEASSYLGPGYICGAPGVNPDLTEVFAIADVPAGRANMHGTCAASLLQLLRAAAFLGCRLEVDPIPGVSAGGHAVSNTVAGSIFVGYLAPGRRTPPTGEVGPEPAWQTLPNDPDFYLWRSFDHDGALSSCPAGSDSQSAALSATQPNPRTGFLPSHEQLVRAGTVTLCAAGNGTALVQLEFERAGATAHATAEGDCRETASLTGPELLVRTCVLGVVWADTPLFRAGQLTSIGLVHADSHLPANSHIWTLGILDDETGATP